MIGPRARRGTKKTIEVISFQTPARNSPKTMSLRPRSMRNDSKSPRLLLEPPVRGPITDCEARPADVVVGFPEVGKKGNGVSKNT